MSPQVKANGIVHWYETLGPANGRPLLLVSGVGGQGIDWDDEFCDLLARRDFRVVRYDLRDSGESELLDHLPVPNAQKVYDGDHTSVCYGVHDLAKDAFKLLEALGVSSAHVVGHSLGSFIAQALVINHSRYVQTLTCIATTTGNPDVGQTSPKVIGNQTTSSRSAADRESALDAWVASRRMQYGSIAFDETRMRAHVGRMYDRRAYGAGRARHVAAAFSAPDRTEQLQRLQVPTLVVHGTEDLLIDVSGGHAVAAAIPGATFLGIEKMGHYLAPSTYELVVDAIDALASR